MNTDNTQSMHEHDARRDFPPEVVLIGALLLIAGCDSVIGRLLEIFVRMGELRPYKMVSFWSVFMQMNWERTTWLLLGIACLAVGWGLLAGAVWARRAAIVVLICLIGYYLLIMVEILNMGAIRYYTLPLNYCFTLASYAIMLLFLNSLRVCRGDHQQRPGILTEIAESLLRRLPSTMPTVYALIALLCFCWGGKNLLYSLDVLINPITVTGVSSHWQFWIIVHLLSLISDIIIIIAGIGLLFNRNWAHIATIGGLALNALLLFTSDLFTDFFQRGASSNFMAHVAPIIILLFYIMPGVYAFARCAVITYYLFLAQLPLQPEPLPPGAGGGLTNDQLLEDGG